MDDMVWFLANKLFSASYSGQSPRLTALFHELSNPQPGDLVYENSSRRPEGRGRLILHRREFVPFDEPEEEEGEKGYEDEFWYIETLDGKLERWRNCSFVKVPEPKPVADNWVNEAIARHELEQTEPSGLDGAPVPKPE